MQQACSTPYAASLFSTISNKQKKSHEGKILLFCKMKRAIKALNKMSLKGA
jgi:hypothetical protein